MTKEEREKAISHLNDMLMWGIVQADGFNALKAAIKSLEQEPCEDCISRKAVIDAINNNRFRYTVAKEDACTGNVLWDSDLIDSNVVQDILNLPPIKPQEPKTISILDGATNGDVIKAKFPDAIKSNYIESSLDMKDYVTIYLGDYEMRVSYDWWNAPYKSGVSK